MKPYHFEDFAVGDRFVSPGMTVTEAAIVDFAMRYDPQPFHVDAVAAARSPFGGLVASGFLTQALSFRLIHQTGIYQSGEGSPGVTELKWLKPVRPGDTIHTIAEVTAQRLSRSRAERGILTMRFDVMNQDGDRVMTWTAVQFVGRRGGGAQEEEGTG